MATYIYRIKKGRTYNLIVVVSGIGDWTGLLSKLYMRDAASGDPDLTLVGSINDDNNTITYPITAANSSSLALGVYNFEIVIYNADKSIVYAPIEGLIIVNDTLKEDPTT